MESYSTRVLSRNVRPWRIGDYYRLPVREFGEIVGVVRWFLDKPAEWSTEGPVMALGFDALAFGSYDNEPLLVTRTPTDWVRRPESWCPLRRDPKRIGVDMLSAGRPLAFTSDEDEEWARQCISAVIMPKMPRLYVERQLEAAQ